LVPLNKRNFGQLLVQLRLEPKDLQSLGGFCAPVWFVGFHPFNKCSFLGVLRDILISLIVTAKRDCQSLTLLEWDSLDLRRFHQLDAKYLRRFFGVVQL
jgi:hypothetical protein